MRKRISSVTGSLPDLLAAFLAVLAVAYGSRALQADAGGMMNVADLCFLLGLATAFGYAAVRAFRATFRTNTRAPIRPPNPISPAISATYD